MTGETVAVDGVTMRVVTEIELADGELVEKSRNFFARGVGIVHDSGTELVSYTIP